MACGAKLRKVNRGFDSLLFVPVTVRHQRPLAHFMVEGQHTDANASLAGARRQARLLREVIPSLRGMGWQCSFDGKKSTLASIFGFDSPATATFHSLVHFMAS